MTTTSIEQERGSGIETPRVTACITGVMARFPGASITADARYFHEVHQHLAPLARELERELIAAHAAIPQSPGEAADYGASINAPYLKGENTQAKSAAIQSLADQAQELNMGYGAPVDERAPDLDVVVKFLCGEEPLEGVWFGSRHPDKRGEFWWRRYLRAALQQPGQAVPDGWRDLIEWLLGKNGQFPTRNSPNEGLYWWRKELRVRYGKLVGTVPGEAG